MTFLILFCILTTLTGVALRFFRPSRTSDSPTPISPPVSTAPPVSEPPPAPAPPSEPSCAAKGIAKAWIDDQASWTIKRTSTHVSHHYGHHTTDQVTLRHAKLGIRIQATEYSTIGVYNISAYVNDKPVIYDQNWGQGQVDQQTLSKAINDHPYPALKRMIDRRVKNEETRAVRIKAIEKLGCP